MLAQIEEFWVYRINCITITHAYALRPIHLPLQIAERDKSLGARCAALTKHLTTPLVDLHNTRERRRRRVQRYNAIVLHSSRYVYVKGSQDSYLLSRILTSRIPSFLTEQMHKFMYRKCDRLRRRSKSYCSITSQRHGIGF